MAWDDPATDGQLGMIRGAARRALPDFGEYHGEEMYANLDPLVMAVYGCRVTQLNRGQASMLITDLRYHAGESDEAPEWESVV